MTYTCAGCGGFVPVELDAWGLRAICHSCSIEVRDAVELVVVDAHNTEVLEWARAADLIAEDDEDEEASP